MKFFSISSALFFICVSSNVNQCGQGRVPDQQNFCIEPKYIEGCLKYQDENTCLECEQGYKIGSYGCDALQFVQRSQKLTGCLQKSQDKSKCENCAKGFVKIRDKCQIGISDCVVYVGSDTCIKCRLGYSLILNQCRFNKILGCKSHNNDQTCQECEKPFELKDINCNVSNCKSLNDYGCVTCLCGYYLTREKICKKIQYGCVRYERGRCVDCMKHYRLKGGHCEIQGCLKYYQNSCIQCKEQYLNQNGGCVFKNCSDWLNNACFACLPGFRLEKGLCQNQEQLLCIDN